MLNVLGASYETGITVYLFSAELVSERRGSLTQNRRKKKKKTMGQFSCMIIVVYLRGHGIFHPVTVLLGEFYSSPDQLLG